jgi:hypothetical protein
VPLSVLRGGRPPGGRWTEHDRSVAVALTLYEASLCSGCGHPVEESADPDADPHAPSGAWHYEAPAPTRCHACTALAATQADYHDAPHPQALRWRAVRIDHEGGADG